MLMKNLSVPNGLSTVLHRFRALLFVVMSVFFIGDFSTVNAQTVRAGWLTDTVGDPLYDFDIFLNNTRLCLNREEQYIRVTFLHGGVSWGHDDVEWVFPDITMPSVAGVTVPGWVVSDVEPGAGYDIVTFEFQSDPTLLVLREIQLGGRFIGNRRNAGGDIIEIASITIPFHPMAHLADTILMDSILCHGETVVARVFRRPPGLYNSALSEFYEPGRMLFRWAVLDGDDNVIPSAGVVAANSGDTAFVIANFDPDIHRAITVQRAFCHNGWFLGPGVALADIDIKERNFYEDTTIVVISDPPLPTEDTDDLPRQDTLLRLAWLTPVGEEEPRWVSIDMQDPVCVNYGNTINVAGANFGHPDVGGFSVPSGIYDDAISAGFLFFQVGTVPDTMLRYVWEYDEERLERVFVAVGSPLGSTAHGRWNRMLDSIENDPWSMANFGGFGRDTSLAGVPNDGGDTYRIAFRVRALPEGDPRIFEDITVRVRPFCPHCSDPDDTLDILSPNVRPPFYNRLLSANVGRAFDTVKPFYQFNIYRSLGRPDTTCVELELGFFALPRPDGVASWNMITLLNDYNIENFAGHFPTIPAGIEIYGTTDLGGVTTNPTLTGSVEVMTSHPGLTRLWRTFTPQNRCFVRRAPTMPLPLVTTADGRDTFGLQPQDEYWHRITTFYLKEAVRAPIIYDPARSRVLNPATDTIFICRYQIMDSLGDDFLAGGERGVSLILAVSGTDSAGMMRHPELRVTGLLPGAIPVFPINTAFFGFYNDRGEDGHPEEIEASFDNIGFENDPFQRTRIWLRAVGDITNEYGYLTFAAQDMCGRGVYTRIPFVIIDVVNVPEPVFYVFGDLPFTWASLEAGEQHFCEGERFTHWVANIDDLDRNRGASIVWWLPDTTWTSVNVWPLGETNDWDMIFGRYPGRLSVNVVNQCGGSSRVFSPEIVPIQRFRSEGFWNPLHEAVCEDTRYTFGINYEWPFFGHMDDLTIEFPSTWSVMRNVTTPVDLEPPFSNVNVVPGLEVNVPGRTLLPFDVIVRNPQLYGDSGVVRIQWLDQRCDTPWSGRPVENRRSQDWWDTTHVFTHLFPLAPRIVEENWNNHIADDGYFTFCLRHDVWLSVEAVLRDTLQEIDYFWEFPDGWSFVEWGPRGPNSDSVLVTVGYLGVDHLGDPLGTDTIRVEARSARCRVDDDPFLFQREDVSVLRIPVRVTDTVVFVMDSLLDFLRDDYGFVSDVCDGEELRLYINRTFWYDYHSVDSIGWRWGLTATTIEDDVVMYPSENNHYDWYFSNKNDTLAIELRGSTEMPLHVQLVLRNHCGITFSDPIILTVADAFIRYEQIYFEYPVQWDGLTNATVEFCEGDLVTISVHAIGTTNYIWTFPWYPFVRTTLTSTIELDIPEEMYADSLDVNGHGFIRVRAFNMCDTTNWNYMAHLEVTDIWAAPRAPRIYDGSFGQLGIYTDGSGHDWILDTVCLRQQFDGWQIAIHEDDVPYPGGWAPFQWTILGTGGVGASNDINVLFDFTSSTDSSTFNVIAQDAGVPADIYNTWINVSVARAQCPTAPGEILRIRLTSVDTIPINEFIGIVTVPAFEFDYRPCPGSTVTFRVLEDLALGYRWILPEDDTTWSFAGHPYTTRMLTGTYEIDIIIGDNPGQIGVVTTTSRGDGTYFCDEYHVNEEVLLSDMITPFPTPILDGFSIFPSHACAMFMMGTPIAVAVDPETPADSIHFVLRKHLEGEYVTTLDTIIGSTTLILAPFGDWEFDSIFVTAQAISIRCTTYAYEQRPRLSNIIQDSFRIYNSPEIELIGSLEPCRGVDQIYEIELSDPGVTFTFTFYSFPPSSVIVTTAPSGGQPETITAHFLDHSDSVRFVFTEMSSGGGCTFPASNDTITLRTNVTPGGGFYFEPRYRASVCPGISNIPLEIVNTGVPIVFEAAWYSGVVNPNDITDTTWTPIPNSVGQDQIEQDMPADASAMHFRVEARYSRCVTTDGITVVEPDTTRVSFTVTAVDPIVATITAQTVRIVGNRVDVLELYRSGIDSVRLGENLRFIGRAEGRPDEFPHLVMHWSGDFESDRILFGPIPENRDTMFSGTVFTSDQRFFFAVEDTAAFGGYNLDGSTFGCISWDSVVILIREFGDGDTQDDDEVFGSVPNAFTPHNADGVNDIFMPGVDRLTILNRWGVVIFHAEGAAARRGWDGRDSRTNRLVDRGDYFFIIEIHRPSVTNLGQPSYTHSKTGVVTVL